MLGKILGCGVSLFSVFSLRPGTVWGGGGAGRVHLLAAALNHEYYYIHATKLLRSVNSSLARPKTRPPHSAPNTCSPPLIS
jgi:hypothetical protein